jgi:hypothetical protein
MSRFGAPLLLAAAVILAVATPVPAAGKYKGFERR